MPELRSYPASLLCGFGQVTAHLWVSVCGHCCRWKERTWSAFSNEQGPFFHGLRLPEFSATFFDRGNHILRQQTAPHHSAKGAVLDAGGMRLTHFYSRQGCTWACVHLTAVSKPGYMCPSYCRLCLIPLHPAGPRVERGIPQSFLGNSSTE